MKTMHVRFPNPIADAVREKAQAGNESISGFIRDAVIAAIIACPSACPSDGTATRTPKENERNEKESNKEKVKKGKETERDIRARAKGTGRAQFIASAKGTTPDAISRVPPTFTEVQEYAQSNDNMRAALEEHPDLAAKFYDFYMSKGWMVGNSPMKNWKSACRNWWRRRGEFMPRQNDADAKVAARDAKEKREREAAKRERLEAAKHREAWSLCEERCAKFRDGKCSEGAKWPPQFNDRPIPPQECSRFAELKSFAVAETMADK